MKTDGMVRHPNVFPVIVKIEVTDKTTKERNTVIDPRHEKSTLLLNQLKGSVFLTR
jgi:hypothetical protein